MNTIAAFGKNLCVRLLLCFIMILFSAVAVNATPADADSTEHKESKLPVISLATGLMRFIGDVGYSQFNQPLLPKGGFQLEVQLHSSSSLSLAAFLLTGKVAGEDNTRDRHINFVSSIVAEGLQMRYDFKSRTKADQFITPYISAGVELMFFHPKGDLKDANGTPYHYWSDGTIRSLEQNDVNASQAKIIYRDYEYETDLKDANIDSLGHYRTSTFAFPVGAGVRFRLSGRCSMNFGTALHFTSSDMIDNVNSESKGEREGNSMKDKILFSSVSFRYDLAAPREVPKKIKKKPSPDDYASVDFNALTSEDADHDGIPDIDDDFIDTAGSVNVDARGKPLDKDEDGIPDYRDKELTSAKGALVNEDGVTITEDMIEARWRKDSLAALPAIVEYLHSVDRLNQMKWAHGAPVKGSEPPKTEGPGVTFRKSIPEIYRKLDLNKDKLISAAEISLAIDDYIAKRSPFNVQQFYDLIDFFFSQQ